MCNITWESLHNWTKVSYTILQLNIRLLSLLYYYEHISMYLFAQVLVIVIQLNKQKSK